MSALRTLLTVAALFALFATLPPALAKWGADINAGAGPKLIGSVAPGLVEIVNAADEDARSTLIGKLAAERGTSAIEALKRFRNPELKSLFLSLAKSEDWTVRHRALYSLEYFGGADALDAALENVAHEQVRLRERAVIACIKLWDGRDTPPAIEARMATEDDFHVRRCLDALQQRIAGKLYVERVYVEHVHKRDDGLAFTPFLSGMNHAAKVAPGYRKKANARQGGGTAAKLPPAARWVRPLLGYGDEVVKGTSLQPFANLRQNGTVYHVGHDVGASLDGAGYYAPAEGIVKLVHSGSDMGTLLVVEHHLGGKALVNGVYMHGGDTVFVKAGDRVSCGQLLGTMGMSYSIENGGHYAHLHYGMYPGPFSMTHNYGYKPVKAGLADWYDPDPFVAGWIARTQPIVPDLPPAPETLADAWRHFRAGAYGPALAALESAGEGADSAYGQRMKAALVAAPAQALARVDRLRADGYPQDALRRLAVFVAAVKGLSDAEAVSQRHAAWKKDKAFQTEVKAEKAFVSSRKRAQKAKDPKKARAIWDKFLKKYGDLPVAARAKSARDR